MEIRVGLELQVGVVVVVEPVEPETMGELEQILVVLVFSIQSTGIQHIMEVGEVVPILPIVHKPLEVRVSVELVGQSELTQPMVQPIHEAVVEVVEIRIIREV